MHMKDLFCGRRRRDGAGRVEINQEHCDTLRCFFTASVPRKESKKRRKKKTFDFLCRIAAGAETAKFFSLSCAAAAPIAKVLVSNRPRVFKKNKNFSPQRLWIRSGRGGFSLLFLKSALRFKLKPTAFHSPCLPPRF